MLDVQNNVIIGDNNELYLASDRHFTIDLMLGNKEISGKSLENFSKNIETRSTIARRQKAQYIHMVAPDKHVVRRKNFPIRDFIALGDIYRDHVGDKFIYPVDELSESAVPTYSLTDTHWNVFGQNIIAKKIAESFGFSKEESSAGFDILQKCVVRQEQPFVGDLGVKLSPPIDEVGFKMHPTWEILNWSNGIRSGNDGRINASYSRSPIARGRLVIFGDSFLAQTHAALSVFFREILFCRTRFLHHEIVVGARPDFILTANVERYLSNVSADSEAPPMLLMAALAGRPANCSTDDIEAIAAYLSGRGRIYRNFMAKIDGKTPK